MSAFWSGFVVVITLASLAGCLWLLFANARQQPGKGGGAGDTGHVWDDDLRELNQPLPRWWLNVFVLSVIFALGYLVLYPGLGNYAGRLGWTQQAQAAAALDAARARRAQIHAQFAGRDFGALATDPAATALGRELFLNNCAGCHGADARGALGFPDLTDGDWLYGGTPEAIVASITLGRAGAMPAFGGALAPDKIDALATFLPRWHDPTLDAGSRAAGLQAFGTFCAACHGADGTGNVALGAPNLTDKIWLHGADRVRESIVSGRTGTMPAHAQLLPAEDIRLVAAYVHGLSQSGR